MMPWPILPIVPLLAACTPGETIATPALPPCESTAPYTSWEDPLACELRDGVPGLELREGWFDYFTQSDCERSVIEEGTCYGNQPASPYNQFRFPEDDVGEIMPVYQLGPDEAILYFGHTPPTGRYWGFSHYQYVKAVPDGVDDVTFGTNAPSLNPLTATVAGTSPTTPFDDTIAVLMTANQTTWDRARELLGPVFERHGYSADLLNLVTIGYADDADYQALLADPAFGAERAFQIRMGYGPDADWHTTVIRMADPEDLTNPYLPADLHTPYTSGTAPSGLPADIPAAVWKLSLTEEHPVYDPLPFPLLPPVDATGETQGEELRAARDAVADAIATRFTNLGYAVDKVPFDNLPQKTSQDCADGDEPCGGNNDDCRYLRANPKYTIPDEGNREAAVFVVGVIHDRVKAVVPTAPDITYSSISLINHSKGAGLISLMDRDLEDSLPALFPDGVPGVADELEPLLYVHVYARVCPAEYGAVCTELPPYTADDALGIAGEDVFWFTERVYLNPGSRTAPHETSVIEPIAGPQAMAMNWNTDGSPILWHVQLD
jgi:hypothetical protein